jgi:drug/metabolite transporter (DMT)-like permease
LSISGACIKLLAGRIPVLEICLARSVLALAASVALSRAARIAPLWGHPSNARLLVLRGVCGTAAVAMTYTSIKLLPLGDAVSLNMLKPCAVALMGAMLLGERLTRAAAAGLAVALAGVVAIARPPLLLGGDGGGGGWSHERAAGVGAALVGAFCASGVAFAIRRIAHSEAALTVRRAARGCGGTAGARGGAAAVARAGRGGSCLGKFCAFEI